MTRRGAQFRAECQGKVRFASAETARSCLAKHRDKPDGADMHVYRCSFCSCWHLGHVPEPPLRYHPKASGTWRYADA